MMLKARLKIYGYLNPEPEQKTADPKKAWNELRIQNSRIYEKFFKTDPSPSPESRAVKILAYKK